MFTALEAINRLSDKREIFYDEMVDLMRQVMEGKVSQVQLAAILMGLHVKTETVSEIAAAAQVMREFSTKVEVSDMGHLVDTCGTGGDKAHTFNVSTTAAFVAAAAGAKVAKHGGRSVSSQSGSADVLEALSINLNLTPAQVAESIRKIGVGFMFAPNHHPAMKYAAPRKSRSGRSSTDSIRSIINSAAHKDEVGLALVRAVGLCPPGTYVRLDNNELAVVIRRSSTANFPYVAIVITKAGELLPQPRLHRTADATPKIQAAMAASAVRARINHHLVLQLGAYVAQHP